ncbi:MAG TPA: outer membrane beta-barrel protein [Terriglobales bacterium]|nr:outer membrane beta-barrel protein [Terriglobales bacterium]
MRKLALVLLASFFLTGVALAQLPGGKIFFGYSYANAALAANSNTNLNGWNGSLEGKIFPYVGIVADIGGYYGSQTVNVPIPVSASGSVYTVMFGPQVSFSVGKVTPFAHGLFGVGHASASSQAFSNSDTSFATALGGGFDYKLIPAVAWRFQGDYLQTRFFSSTQDNFRFSTGIVLHF